MRCVTVHAEIRASTGDGRFASPAQIVHADYVAFKLGQQRSSAQQNYQARE
jgi:hypothetical protein